jgi:hypothetical protein
MPDAAPRHLRWLRGWARELVIILAFYYGYETIRSFADHTGITSNAYANAHRLVTAERWLHIFWEQPIQHALLPATWLIKAMNIYYGTLHFVVTAGLLIWLYVRRRAVYRSMRNLLGLTTSLALIGYYSFPLAPPRLYKCNNNIPVPTKGGYVIGRCFVDTLDKVGGLWSYHSPVAKAVANQYAAMPSLHFGWALWCAIVMWRHVQHHTNRVWAVLYPALTLFAIVVTANHWFLDAFGGTVIVVAALLIVDWWHRRHPLPSSEVSAPAS